MSKFFVQGAGTRTLHKLPLPKAVGVVKISDLGFGMFLYDEYYIPNGKLPVVDLLDAIDKYKDADKMDLKSSPRKFIPRYTEYKPSHFYME